MKIFKTALAAIVMCGFGLVALPQQAKADITSLSQQTMESVKGQGKCCNDEHNTWWPSLGQKPTSCSTDDQGRATEKTISYYKTCSTCGNPLSSSSCPNSSEPNGPVIDYTLSIYDVTCSGRTGATPTNTLNYCATGCSGTSAANLVCATSPPPGTDPLRD